METKVTKQDLVKKVGLWLLFAFFLIKGLFWIAAFPAFQAPDEVTHFYHVYTVKEFRPALWEKVSKYGMAAAGALPGELEKLEVEHLRFNPLNHQLFTFEEEADFSLDASEEETSEGLESIELPKHASWSLGYLPLYYYLNIPATWISDQVTTQLMGMRVISLGFLLLTLFFVYLIGKGVFNSRKLALVLTILVGFQPMFNYIMVSVNNDVLLNLVFAAFFYLVAKGLKTPGFSGKLFVLLWLVAGVGILVKPQAYLLIFLIGIFLLFKLLQRKGKFWWLYLAGVIISWGVIGKLAMQKVLLSKFWINNELLSDFLETHSSIWIAKTLVFKRLFTAFYRTFWADFGWLDTLVAKPYYFLMALLVLVGIVGAAVYLIKSLWHWKKFAVEAWVFLFFLISCIALETVFFFMHMSREVASRSFELMQGRYYFIVIVPIMALLLKGILTLIPKKMQKLGAFILVGGLIFFNFICLVQYILPRYYS